MATSNIKSVSDVYIVDAATAEAAVKEVIQEFGREDLERSLSTLKEVRINVFSYFHGENSMYAYTSTAYVECFLGEFRVTVTIQTVDK